MQDPREKFSDPGATIVNRVKNYMQGVVSEVFADGRVNTEGYNFLERLFKHAQTTEAGVYLLNNVL